jgi:peptidoglycan-N-acetylmuramic acid deacetylase
MSFIEKYEGYYLDKNHTDYASKKVIYLTFDAGYENGNIAKILDILKEREVPAAFFVLSNIIKKDTDLIKRMVEDGHTVCNHTASHRDMTKIKNIDEFKSELEALESVYKEYTGLDMAKFYRPPEGKFSEQNLQFANELGYKTIFWSFAYADWDNAKQPSLESAYNLIMSNIHNGAILLLHPTSSTNAEILGRVIDDLKIQGFTFGTLDQLTTK